MTAGRTAHSMRISTEAIWGLRAMRKCRAEHYADWAITMLEAGHDSKHLRVLAGIESKSSVFEAEEYFQQTAAELGLEEPSNESAMKAYCIYVAEQIVERKVAARDGVTMLFLVCMDADYPKNLMIWFHPHDACEDLRYGYEPYSYPGLTKMNLEETVIKEAMDFVASETK